MNNDFLLPHKCDIDENKQGNPHWSLFLRLGTWASSRRLIGRDSFHAQGYKDFIQSFVKFTHFSPTGKKICLCSFHIKTRQEIRWRNSVKWTDACIPLARCWQQNGHREHNGHKGVTGQYSFWLLSSPRLTPLGWVESRVTISQIFHCAACNWRGKNIGSAAQCCILIFVAFI